MKVTIDSVEVDGEKLKAVLKLEADLNASGMCFREHDIARHIERNVIERCVEDISKKILLERGPSIYEQISDKQIINSVLVRLASNMGSREC